jgi:hypothetical protein
MSRPHEPGAKLETALAGQVLPLPRKNLEVVKPLIYSQGHIGSYISQSTVIPQV